MSNRPIWSFVIRRPDGRVVTRSGKMNWTAAGDSKTDAEMVVRSAAAKASGFTEGQLTISGTADNWAAEELDRKGIDDEE